MFKLKYINENNFLITINILWLFMTTCREEVKWIKPLQVNNVHSFRICVISTWLFDGIFEGNRICSSTLNRRSRFCSSLSFSWSSLRYFWLVAFACLKCSSISEDSRLVLDAGRRVARIRLSMEPCGFLRSSTTYK